MMMKKKKRILLQKGKRRRAGLVYIRERERERETNKMERGKRDGTEHIPSCAISERSGQEGGGSR